MSREETRNLATCIKLFAHSNSRFLKEIIHLNSRSIAKMYTVGSLP